MPIFNKLKPNEKLILEINELFTESIVKKVSDKEQGKIAAKTQELLSKLDSNLDEDLLRSVYETIRKMSMNLDLMFIYCDRLETIIDKYVYRKQSFYIGDDEVSNKNADLNVEIELRRKAANKLDAEIKALAKKVVDENIPQNSPDYIALSSKYDNLKTKLNNTLNEMGELIGRVKLNSKIETLLSKESINEFEQYNALPLSEVVERVGIANQKHEEVESRKQTLENALDSLYESKPISDIDINEFAEEIRKTRLEVLKEESKTDEDYLSKIGALHEDEILKALSELSSKIDTIKEDSAKDKAELQKLFKETYEDIVLKDVGNDLEKRVNFLLSSNPPDYQSAHVKLRACIENYCRYIKGVDMNDGVTTTSVEVAEKLRSAGIPSEDFERIKRIYCESNPFVHSNEEVTSIKIENDDITHIKEDAKFLAEKGYNDYSSKEGMPKYMKSVDDALVKSASEGTSISNKPISRALEGQVRRATYLSRHGVKAPEFALDYSSKEKARNSYSELLNKEEPAKEKEKEPEIEENIGEHLEGTIISFSPKLSYGFIESNKKSYFFHIKSVVGSTVAHPIHLKQGERVRFVTTISDVTGKLVADKVERI